MQRGDCAIRHVEEFWASEKGGTVAKYLSEEERDRVHGHAMQAEMLQEARGA
jgi:hypothetical protein